MTWPDLVNATFGAGASLAICVSIGRLWADRKVAGVSPVTIGFFTAWGAWNLFYYPHLGQWGSFAAGLLVCTANLIYCGLLVYFRRHPGRSAT